MFFSVSGFGNLKGSLTIEASYQPSSAERVDITFVRASLVRCPHSFGPVQSLYSFGFWQPVRPRTGSLDALHLCLQSAGASSAAAAI